MVIRRRPRRVVARWNVTWVRPRASPRRVGRPPPSIQPPESLAGPIGRLMATRLRTAGPVLVSAHGQAPDHLRRRKGSGRGPVDRLSRLLPSGTAQRRHRRARRAVALDLGYRSAVLASQEARSRTRMIALIVPDITNPFYFEIIRGAESAASESGYTLVLAEPRSLSASSRRRSQGPCPSSTACCSRPPECPTPPS
jgi:hypothetical protein